MVIWSTRLPPPPPGIPVETEAPAVGDTVVSMNHELVLLCIRIQVRERQRTQSEIAKTKPCVWQSGCGMRRLLSRVL